LPGIAIIGAQARREPAPAHPGRPAHHPDAALIAEIDLDQSNAGYRDGPQLSVIVGQKLRSFPTRFRRRGNLHRRKTWPDLPHRSRLSAPGEHHARRNPIAARHLSHLCARRQRLLKDPHLVVM
jgi:hypothetical protein